MLLAVVNVDMWSSIFYLPVIIFNIQYYFHSWGLFSSIIVFPLENFNQEDKFSSVLKQTVKKLILNPNTYNLMLTNIKKLKSKKWKRWRPWGERTTGDRETKSGRTAVGRDWWEWAAGVF